MTEDEAKKKWCPLRHQALTAGKDEIDGQIAMVTYSCIGSACMAWREQPPDRTLNGKPIADNVLVYPEEAVTKIPRGYCGMAGTP